MKRFSVALVALLTLCFAQTAWVEADEGMWLPPAIGNRLPMELLQKRGLKLSREALWSEDKPSLKDAFLQIGSIAPDQPLRGFGSGSFVSSQGLVLTNHHVAFDAIAALSKPEENLIETGFVAKTLAEERACAGTGMRLTTLYEDVSAQMLEGITDETPGAERQEMIKTRRAALIRQATDKGFQDVRVEEMLFGRAYYRVAYDTFRDIRLVYAPQRAIGEYGGDTDNWMWPRHTGDFTYFRVYVGPDGSRAEYSQDNVPFEPKQHLRVSTKGYQASDFSFIMGYPGSPTRRNRSSYSIEYWERFLGVPQLKGYKALAARLENETDEAKRLENAADLKSIYNTLKNFQGKVAGLERTQLVARKRAEEERIQTWLKADKTRLEQFGDPFAAIATLYKTAAFPYAWLTGIARNSAAAIYLDPQPSRYGWPVG